MIKQIVLVKKKSGMSFDDFKKDYLEFAQFMKKNLPEIKKYTINFALQRGKETPFDAVTELCWDDIDAIVRMLKSDLFKNEIMPYEKKFIELKDVQIILTEEFPQK